MKRITTLSVATLAAAASVAMAVSTASASADSLTGNGSTLVAPLLTGVWAPGFQKADSISVTYGAVGSGTGITDITNHVGDFGASDAPLSTAQAGACSDCIQIPWALSATAVSYNLAGVTGLKLTGPVLAEIFSGQITTWNNPAITALNKGVTLPATKITPVVRSDGSGDTYAFTNYLSKVSTSFASTVLAGAGPATLVTWPSGDASGKGNSGVAAVITATPGAIGYVSAFYVRDDKLSEAQIANASGNYEYAYDNTIEDAAAAVSSLGPANATSIVNPPKAPKPAHGKAALPWYYAYPISTYTYVIVHKNASQAADLQKFIDYALSVPASAIANYTFAPLPTKIKAQAMSAVAGI